MVKYIGSFVSYAIFLLLYTSVALWNFEWQYRSWEVAVYVWLIILMVDESREIFLQPAGSIYTDTPCAPLWREDLLQPAGAIYIYACVRRMGGV